MSEVERHYSQRIEEMNKLKAHYFDILLHSDMSADEILSEFDPNTLAHYGKGHLDGGHSGRYPYGSGEDPYQHEVDLYTRIKRMHDSGMTNQDICKELELESVNQLRNIYSNARVEHRQALRERVLKLREDGYSRQAVADKLGLKGESTVRSLEEEAIAKRTGLTNEKAEELRSYVNANRYVDISAGVEIQMGISASRLDKVVSKLQEEGYQKMYVKFDQMGTNHQTYMKVLVPPDVTYKELYEHRYDIRYPSQRTFTDTGLTKLGINPPVSVDSKRIAIRYPEEGGKDLDGLIELRRGVDDISLGKAQYAQVRIAVDGTHYMKGMARYSDDLPPGIDIRFNTNYPKGTPMLGPKGNTVLKPMKDDPDNPFGATIKTEEQLTMAQRRYFDKSTGEWKQSAINIVNEQGAWDSWRKALPSQFLSKQTESLAKRQLNLAYTNYLADYDDICKLTNPTIKRKLLEDFSDNCDKASVDLKAAALPRQAAKVLLPYNDIAEDEVYAPGYNQGEEVALIRFPHGGTFEIPICRVNNKRGSEADKTMHNAPDAIGINHKVAERLSGADFDGDTVLVIPVNDSVKIRSTPPLKGLKDFDPKEQYPGYPGMKVMSDDETQKQMGIVTNLITDMTLQGANTDELAAAVRHSMVVIDAHKHELDYKRSERENHIDILKQRYQYNPDTGKGGAGTLISRAKSPEYVNQRKIRTGINSSNTDPITGEKIFKETGEHYIKRTALKDGTIKEEDIYRKEKVPKMSLHSDAYELTSGGSKDSPRNARMENIYAEHANRMKALANQARLEYMKTPKLHKDPEAAKRYSEEVESLNRKLKIALSNAPRERQAQLLAGKRYYKKIEEDETLDNDAKKKLRNQALNAARKETGAHKVSIDISDKEWEAIQNGAISDSVLMKILNNANTDRVKQLATPRTKISVSPAKEAKAKAMARSGYTLKEISDAIGVSPSTVSKIINPGVKKDI